MIFRYPGAKNHLLPALKPFLDGILEGATVFHDVFVGGGSVLLHVARQHPKISLHANDLDADIADFWRVVAGNGVGELCDRLRITPTIDMFYEFRARKPASRMDRAFQIIFFNRTCFSGLWRDTPIGGRMQNSRYKVFNNWTGKDLIREIRDAHDLLKGRTVVTNQDGAEHVRRHPLPPKYVDPPYFRAGRGLYQQRMILAGHLRLAAALRGSRNWVLSYDLCPVVGEIYSWARCHAIAALYRAHQKRSKCVRGTELVIVPRGQTGANRATERGSR